MELDLVFLQGTEETYQALEEKKEGTFYLTEENLYLGEKKLTNDNEIKTAVNKINNLTSALGELNNLEESISKDNLVSAINDVLNKSKINIEESSSEEYAKIYTVTQGKEEIGKINIPKDMVVSDGSVVQNPQDKAEGTYIKLILANAEKSEIFINVTDLIDIYKPKAGADEIQLAVEGKEISASIVTKGIKKEKLNDDVFENLVTTGTEKGNINFNGNNIPVNGLGTAAYEDKLNFDPAGSASSMLAEAKQYIDNLFKWKPFPEE